MKSLLLATLIYLLCPVFATEENCLDQPADPCAGITEYNAYLSCLDENKRHKRSIGCPLLAQADSCEYVDCQACEESCLPDCPDCECSSSCRQCCSETCTTNLCCHKTCHNQCKTNYCRAECKKECKERIYQQGDISFGEHNANIGVNVLNNRTASNQAKHNITTIINLHNIINNTNLIDIPIRINNTNFNNITLKRAHDSRVTSSGYAGYEGGQETSSETGEKCCYVVSPRQCVKTNYHPFMRCFHYRHKKCGPFCIANIVHAQNQNYCDESGCHNKIFYIPQVQPKCFYTPTYPFVNCGGQQTFHNCQGCYDHISSGTATTGIHHHMRCSRCYDNGAGSNNQLGPMYQPPVMPGYPMGYPMGYGMGGFYGGYPGMPPMLPPMPMYQPNPAYGQPFGAPQFYGQGQQYFGQGQQYFGQGQQYFGQGQQYFGQGQQFYGGINPEGAGPIENEIIDSPSSDNYNEVNMKYPVGHYIHETVVPADQLLKSGAILGEDTNKANVTDDNSSVGASRYALISIDAAKPSHHDKRDEKKDRRYRRKKDKHDHDQTTENKKENKSSTVHTAEKKSSTVSLPNK